MTKVMYTPPNMSPTHDPRSTALGQACARLGVDTVNVAILTKAGSVYADNAIVPTASWWSALVRLGAVTPAPSLQQHGPGGIPPAYFTPRKLAARWMVCVDKVLRFIQTGELRAFNVASKESRRPRYRISIEEVRRFEEQTRSAAPPPATKAPSPCRRKTTAKEKATRTYF